MYLSVTNQQLNKTTQRLKLMALTESLDATSELRLPERKPESCKGKFEKLLVEAVDYGLSSLGDSCRQAIYFYLENNFKIGKKEIPYRIEDFANAIEQIFGPGARLIEIEIMKVLHKKVAHFEYSPKQEDIVFTEYIASLRHFL